MPPPTSDRPGTGAAPVPRVVIAKVGLDGHERGARLVAHALREGGIDVAYTGLRRTAEQAVEAVLRHRAHYLGLSLLAGDHMVQVPRVLQALRERGLSRTRVLVGGIIARHQVPALLALGVTQVFLPGTPLAAIRQFVHDDFRRHPIEESRPWSSTPTCT